MKEFGVTVEERGTGKRYTDSTWSTIEEAADRAKFLEAFMPGAIVHINDWSDIPKATAELFKRKLYYGW